MPRVAIADDHLPMRRSISRALTEAGYEVVSEAATGPAAVIAAIVLRPDIAILDVRMHGDGLTAAARIVEELPDTAVVMFTATIDADTYRRAFLAGARGVLSKDTDAADLPAALRRVLEGEVGLPAILREQLAVRAGAPQRRRRWGRHATARREEAGPALGPAGGMVLPHLRAGETIAATARAVGLPEDQVRLAAAELLPSGG